MSHLHRRLGGTGDPEPAGEPRPRPASSVTPEFVTVRCRSEVTQLHAVNLVADIADAAQRAALVLVDLTLTARIDGAGLGALVSGGRAARDVGSELRIVGAHGMVAQALRFTGLSLALSTHPTVEDALHGP